MLGGIATNGVITTNHLQIFITNILQPLLLQCIEHPRIYKFTKWHSIKSRCKKQPICFCVETTSVNSNVSKKGNAMHCHLVYQGTQLTSCSPSESQSAESLSMRPSVFSPVQATNGVITTNHLQIFIANILQKLIFQCRNNNRRSAELQMHEAVLDPIPMREAFNLLAPAAFALKQLSMNL